MKRYAIALLTVLVVFSAASWYRTYASRSFLIAQLESANVAVPLDTDALKLAYERELARRAPLLGLAGTDPAALEKNTDALEQALEKLSAIQETPEFSALIHSLYPVSFLRSLAELEAARQAFIDSGAAADEQHYDSALSGAAAAGERDARVFESSFKVATHGREAARFPTFADTITTRSMLRSIATIQTRMREVEQALSARLECARGLISSCTALKLTALTVPPTIPDNAKAAAAGKAFIIAASPRLQQEAGEVVLDESSCVAALAPPYHLLAITPNYSDDFVPVQFLNDIFFSDLTERRGPLSDAMKARGITFWKISPEAYYLCPQAGADLGEMRAATAAVALAKTYPELAVDEREALVSSGSVRATNARRYMNAAIEELQRVSPEEMNAIVAVYSMFKEQSGGLDYLVGDIALVSEGDVQIHQSGIPFDESAPTLFLTHSAFPSLFLTQNSSAGTSHIHLIEHNDNEFKQLLDSYARYSALRSTVGEERLLRETQTLYRLERDSR